VRNFYALLAQGDAPTALGLLDPRVEWTEAEGTPYYAGTVTGPKAVVATVLAPITADFDDFAAAPSDFIAEGQRVVAFGTYSGVARSTGRRLSVPFVHVWTAAGERLRRFDQYTDSARWNAALGRSPPSMPEPSDHGSEK
jgi:hypothetical protein